MLAQRCIEKRILIKKIQKALLEWVNNKHKVSLFNASVRVFQRTYCKHENSALGLIDFATSVLEKMFSEYSVVVW